MYKLILVLSVTWVVLANNMEFSRLSNTGLLKTETQNKITLLQDSVIISFLFDPNEVKTVWNNFIEALDHLSHSMENNECLSSVLVECRTDRVKIKQIIDGYNATGLSKNKRQAFLGAVGTLSSLLSFGLTQYELSIVNNKIDLMRGKLG